MTTVATIWTKYHILMSWSLKHEGLMMKCMASLFRVWHGAQLQLCNQIKSDVWCRPEDPEFEADIDQSVRLQVHKNCWTPIIYRTDSNVGNIVSDFMMGWGSTGVAAW